MTEHVTKTIAMFQSQIADLERELSKKKLLVNELCLAIEQPPIYSDTDPSNTACRALRSDEFYGQPLATAIRLVLERRRAGGLGSVTVNDIYDVLVEGGYKFDAKNEENAKRGLYSTLTKSSNTFHRLPNGSYGLREWYPNLKERAPKSEANGTAAAEQADDQPFNTDETAEETGERAKVPGAAK
jgi:hypothetical protein